jgi:hypothetical protein
MTFRPRLRHLLPWLSILGLVSLSYLLGAAVMFFGMPTSDYLNKAFIGARAWRERRDAFVRAPRGGPGEGYWPPVLGKVDKPGKTFDGFTLCLFIPGSKAVLLNMRGDVVHEWSVSFSEVWPEPTHVKGPVDDSTVGLFGCYLYPNGDLLVVFHGVPNPANGYGLVKLDKNSRVIWKYAGNFHHDVDVGEDGTVYAIDQKLLRKTPRGLEDIPVPCMVDYLVMLSPEGVKQKEISLLEALNDSPYAALLSTLHRADRRTLLASPAFTPADDDVRRRDVLHTNCVRVLSEKRAPKFPLFKAGQVLFSMRHTSVLGVLDPQSRAVVWAASGPWEAQHDPQFLDDGRLLIFDNLGSAKGSRVLEYDPRTQAFPWSYSGENRGPFLSAERGMSQRLPNGNTLIVNSQQMEILEVTRSKEVVWSCSWPQPSDPRTERSFLSTARRFGPEQLRFLKKALRPRP